MIDNQFFYPEMNAGQEETRQHFQAPGFPYESNAVPKPSYTSQPFQVSGSQVLPLSSQPLDSPSVESISTVRPVTNRRPRPVTMHGSDISGFNYLQAQMAYAPWGTQANLAPTRSGLNAQAFPANQTFYENMGGMEHRPTSMHVEQSYQKLTGTWNPNDYGGAVDMNGLGFASNAGVPMVTNDGGSFGSFAVNGLPNEGHWDGDYNTKRISGSSYTMSTTGDMAGFDDYSASVSEAQSFVTDYPPQSNRTSLLSFIQSPVTSPSMSHNSGPGLHRTHSRGKASPTSKHNVRSTPYSADGRNNRWSTGSYAPTSRRAPSPFVLHPSLPEGVVQCQEPSSLFEPPGPYNHYQPLNIANHQTQQFPYTTNPLQPLAGRSMILPSNDFNERILDTQAPRQIPHSLFRMLQSNLSPSSHTHCDVLSSCPDLLAGLHEPPLPPPASDMNPSDHSLIPHEQELRFETDLYTPRWIRGQGKEREGWCGICKPGKWLVLKTSAYWYDKSFMHGVSAPTGRPFAMPEGMRRGEGAGWEGRCGGCGEWVPLTSHKKKGTTWFRHAYRCHTHPKAKEPTKKSRRSLEHPPPVSRGAAPHQESLRTSGSLNRRTLDSTPEDYDMI